jgi:integrase
MASLYKRQNSPFWWIKFRNHISGKIERESTGFKVGVGADRRRAEQQCAEKTLLETKHKPSMPNEAWDLWVLNYFNIRYANSPESLNRYQSAWRTLRIFLAEKEIRTPRQLTREHCLDYMAWRKQPDYKIGKYKVTHNTALMEIKILSLIMKEAVIRNYSAFNPCRDLHIKRVQGKIKPEIPPEMLDEISHLIDKEPELIRPFFRRSFDIARYHGVRLRETQVNPSTDVELWTELKDGKEPIERGLITFHTKGHRSNTVQLHPKLIPLFKELRQQGKTETYPCPKNRSREWFNFLKRTGMKAKLPNICFHSTRVTVASTFARKGIPENKAMAYLGHASTTIHRSYVRLKPTDLTQCSDALT